MVWGEGGEGGGLQLLPRRLRVTLADTCLSLLDFRPPPRQSGETEATRSAPSASVWRFDLTRRGDINTAGAFARTHVCCCSFKQKRLWV